MNLAKALQMIHAQFPDIPYNPNEEDMAMAVSMENKILAAIKKSDAPLITARDFVKHIPSAEIAEIKAAIRELRDAGRITTTKSGYKIPGQLAEEKAAKKDKPEPKPKKLGIPCLCGCGGMTKPGSFFIPGHDARTKGFVIKVNKGKMDASCLRTALDYGAVVVHKGIYAILPVADIKKLVRL